MTMLKRLVCLAAIAMLVQLVMAATYTVGGATGSWDSSTDLQSWWFKSVLTYILSAVFQYTPNHDVLEVTKADHDSCQTSNPLKTYSDGNTVVPLTSPGKRYFICGTLGHCSQGMQIEINTLATPPSTPLSASPPPKASPSPEKAPELATGSSSQSPETSPSAAPSVSPVPEMSPSPAKTSESAPFSPSPADVTAAESPETASSPSGPLPSPANRNRFGFGLLLVVLLAL
ncbi:Basic helix-loop-helix DNA-binding superfamily protein [Hibiscus syriacus]|uniref:Basic helix-loop-helix DNA-binding superfamily protein n=1 Tax=Hibiscus syriacus TaxID=106335 RepID=A0A6A2ZKI1_HIBSY|nr:Basic helix-loop-helix DNA-binding superfamily protein [Hibiscus syriacus]